MTRAAVIFMATPRKLGGGVAAQLAAFKIIGKTTRRDLWRTTGDLLDMWADLDSVGFHQAGREKHVTHGRWNDIDMRVVGPLGWGPDFHPTRLTPQRAGPAYHFVGDAGRAAVHRGRSDAPRSAHDRAADQ
jgi:hypothetical protein